MSRFGVPLLVIGATGQDGYYLLQAAKAAGIEAMGTTRGNVPGMRTLDPCNGDQMTALLDTIRPARIVLLAGQSSVGRSFDEPEATIKSHTRPVRAVLEWMRVRGSETRLVYAASGECFGSAKDGKAASEASSFRPENPYGEGKCRGAEFVRDFRDRFGVHAANAFLFNHESPRRPAQFVFGKVLAGVEALRSGQSDAPIELGNLDSIRDWGWAPDYASGMLAMTGLDTPRDLVLATGASVSLREAIESLVETAGLDPEQAIVENRRPGDRTAQASAQFADPSLARDVIGWRGSTGFPELSRLLLGDAE